MRFTKMHGIGNDYVYVSRFDEPLAGVDLPALAVALSDRHRGVGSDGLILIGPADAADVRMEMYNADGSRAQMCGNGIRCLAKYAWEHSLASGNPMRVQTDAGVKTLDLTIVGGKVTAVRVDMGPPILASDAIPMRLEPPAEPVVNVPMEVAGQRFELTAVSMGNPHAVFFVDDAGVVPLEVWGPQVEHASMFPERTNVHFVQVLGRDRVVMRTWERGSGATLACGTGACAVCVAGVLTGRTDRPIVAELPGGELQIEWADADATVYMTGPASEVFTGEWPL